MVARDPSLLEKLLATDIRAEHSRLLQCMRFLVANNFLQDVGSKPLLYPPEAPSAAEQPPGGSCLAQVHSHHTPALSLTMIWNLDLVTSSRVVDAIQPIPLLTLSCCRSL